MLIDKVHGNLSGLKAQQVKLLGNVYRRKLSPGAAINPELARTICALSKDIRREISLIIDRRGRILTVSVSDAKQTPLPPVRYADSRLSGFYLLHTHPKGGGLSQSDLSALFLNRLDAVGALEVRADGTPGLLHLAHLTPPNASQEEEDWRIYPAASVYELEDFSLGGQIEALERELTRFSHLKEADNAKIPERAILIQVDNGIVDAEERLAELAELARTAGAEVVHSELVFRSQLKPGTIVGAGKLEEMTSKAYHLNANVLIFGQELSPAQAREVEAVSGLKLLDRTQLILDIFALHASGKESQMQVELAQLRYLKPRLLGQGTALSRLGGGIGTRGPGETKLEMDRRNINDRIAELERNITQLSARRAERRKARSRNAVPVVGIVGYTNAGKSTLLNRLIKHQPDKQVLAENKLFATLRPTSRQVYLPEVGTVVFTDTVGFIRDLPKDLQRAFRATLEELADSTVLLHLVDAASVGVDARIAAVERILRDLELTEIPSVLVLNKADLADPQELALWSDRMDALAISAQSGEGIEPLKSYLGHLLATAWQAELEMPNIPHLKLTDAPYPEDSSYNYQEVLNMSFLDDAINKVKEVAEQVIDKGEELLGDLKEAAENVVEKGEELFEQAKDKGEELFEQAKDAAGNAVEHAKDAAAGAVEKVQEVAGGAANAATGAVDSAKDAAASATEAAAGAVDSAKDAAAGATEAAAGAVDSLKATDKQV